MPPFDHLEVSTPAYTPAGFTFITAPSPALGGRGDLTLFVPPGSEARGGLPLVILLHGAHAGHWQWAFGVGAHAVLLGLMRAGEVPPLALLMPSDGLAGEGSGYVRHRAADYERWIVEDAVAAAAQALPAVGAGSPLFIAGLSMGGYGALRLGAKHAGRFRGVSAHSSATSYALLRAGLRMGDSPFDLAAAEGDDLSALHWLAAHRDRLPPVRFDCGVEDFLIEPNRELHRALDANGVPHTYAEFPGGHTWEYWREHVADSFRFFAGILGV